MCHLHYTMLSTERSTFIRNRIGKCVKVLLKIDKLYNGLAKICKKIKYYSNHLTVIVQIHMYQLVPGGLYSVWFIVRWTWNIRYGLLVAHNHLFAYNTHTHTGQTKQTRSLASEPPTLGTTYIYQLGSRTCSSGTCSTLMCAFQETHTSRHSYRSSWFKSVIKKKTTIIITVNFNIA